MVTKDTALLCHAVAPSRAVLRRLTAALVAVLALAFAVATPAASAHSRRCAHANTPIRIASRSQAKRAVVCLIDEQRRSRGLPGLSASRRLDRSAQGWTNVMVSHRYFSHGADFSARISAVGFNWSKVGENIATGFATPARVVRGWMASTGHCQNILSPIYREIGTGVTLRAISGRTSAGTWTQDFGLLMNQTPASGNWGPADGCPYR